MERRMFPQVLSSFSFRKIFYDMTIGKISIFYRFVSARQTDLFISDDKSTYY